MHIVPAFQNLFCNRINLHLLKFCYSFIWETEKQSEMDEYNSRPLIHSPNVHNDQSWPKLKLGAQDPIP